MEYKSFFERFDEKEEFIDRKTITDEETVDVIIPTINTNIFFTKNLHSYYREIPINRLIVGDAGSTDDTREILSKFPRVKIIDQSNFNSLGYCIAKLMSVVETEWFIYLHADVYLAENWYNTMKKYQDKYDFYECDRNDVIIIETRKPGLENVTRAFSGSQMCRKEAFKNIIPKIEDNYLYRNEDIIFDELIRAEGYKYGRIFDTYHHHQSMKRKGMKQPKIYNIIIHQQKDINNVLRTANMQARGIIKYLKPKPYLISQVYNSLMKLKSYNALNTNEFMAWVKKNNEEWLKYIKIEKSFHIKIYEKLVSLINIIFKKIEKLRII